MIQNYPFQVPILQHISEWGSSSNKTSKIALTAHVLIAMDKTAPALTGTYMYGYISKQMYSQKDRYIQIHIDTQIGTYVECRQIHRFSGQGIGLHE